MNENHLPPAHNGVVAIWKLLASGNKYYRAAAILLLKEYASVLTANGKGEYASRLVQAIRENDPRRAFVKKGDKWSLLP